MIEYDAAAAAAFAAGRQLPPAGLVAWRAAIARYAAVRPGARLLDLRRWPG